MVRLSAKKFLLLLGFRIRTSVFNRLFSESANGYVHLHFHTPAQRHATEINVVVRDGKNLNGRCSHRARDHRRRVLEREFENSIKAIKSRDGAAKRGSRTKSNHLLRTTRSVENKGSLRRDALNCVIFLKSLGSGSPVSVNSNGRLPRDRRSNGLRLYWLFVRRSSRTGCGHTHAR